MRHPDLDDANVMTRRGWWLVILGFLIPGSAQAVAGNRRLGKIGLAATLFMWLVLIASVVTLILKPTLFASFATKSWLMLVAQILLWGYALLWLILSINTLVLVRLVRARSGARLAIAVLGVVLMVVSTGTAAYAANLVGAANTLISKVFGGGGPAQPPSDGYYNILLLGADSGDGRDSMRYDSISVVSINAETGKATVFGIPRDMKQVPFSDGPMKNLYPNGHEGHSDPECGWTSAINQLTTEVNLCRKSENLYPEAKNHKSNPGVEATRDAAQGILGIKIQYYAFIDMDHFAELIDALGGVDINVKQRLPKGGGPAYQGQPADDWAIGWIEAGQQHMNGDTAQWYARSRYTTNDWDRMQRQRILQEAILKQFTPQNIVSRFQSIASAGEAVMETDIPADMVQTFIDLGLKAKSQGMTSVELNPNGPATPNGEHIDPDNADFEQIRALVQQILHPKPEKTQK